MVTDFLVPMIPPEGWDLEGDGTLASPDEVVAFVEEIGMLLADVTLADGTPGISVRLNFEAEPFAD